MVWRPRARTSTSAMRRPRPLLRYPIANTKAPTISHTVLSENPLSIQRSDLLGSCSTYPITPANFSPMMPTAPTGMDSSTSPVTIAANTAK